MSVLFRGSAESVQFNFLCLWYLQNNLVELGASCSKPCSLLEYV